MDASEELKKQNSGGSVLSSVLSPPSPQGIRDELTRMVFNDLLGPAGGSEEELDKREDRVRERYLVGMLAPKATTVEAGEVDAIGVAQKDDPEVGPSDISTPPTDTMFPSSMGMSFMVDPDFKAIQVKTEWGRYRRIKSDTQLDRKGNPASVWKRTHFIGEPKTILLKEGMFGPIVLRSDDPFVILQGKIRQSPDGWAVTLFMLNQQEEPTKKKDEAWVFQPKMRVHDLNDPPRPIFIQRRSRKLDYTKMDPLTREETQALEMLYRSQLEYAVGHGVSVHAILSDDSTEKALILETEYLPCAEVLQQTHPTEQDDPNLASLILDMKELAELDKAKLIANLKILVQAYRSWIDIESKKIADPAEKLKHHQNAAQKSAERCNRALDRIHEGIDLIDTNSDAEEAFRFANKAMWLQRLHTEFARKVRKKDIRIEDGISSLDIPANRSWRLFQLAFILLNLPSITDLKHHDRSHETEAVADLLWFATGGGKTEAYLGLTAYTLALRRLQGEIEGRAGDHGVAVIMRYTLRLLTLQQFQRAAALICACETIRRAKDEKWGTTPFRLGIWVGRKASPNTLQQAAEILAQAKIGGKPPAGGTPHQIVSCPWCGSEIKEQHIKVFLGASEIGRCVAYCGDPLGRCDFSEARALRDEGLPVMVVDEEIYRRPPSLLIATVDKFAQMPWKGETQMLFGKVNGLCTRHGFLSPEIEDSERHPARGALPVAKTVPHGPLRPPDLIIQDELHLIAGPLGSMVGLYEAAVDELCSWTVDGKKIRPKIIASTATIRRASDQVQKLYVRSLEVFPPQGIDINNSFFAIQRSASPESPGRRYVGVCAFGRRYPSALIRIYLALMGGAQKIYEKYDRLADPWMTLTGYFNSIRELAGMRRLVEDEVRNRLRDADQRGLAKRFIRYGAIEELTSRKSGAEIPRILERLDIIFDKVQEAQREADRKAGKKDIPPRPYDVVLATNMISVGVDIDRLGLMVVAGQPKTTSEYIQATSRVGRSKAGPGLVVTMFNWARPRDLSHFEGFEHYHDTFYKHVEALSVTPFATRALDRGLSGVFVALMRLWDDHLNANLKAGELQDDEPLVSVVFEYLAKRAEVAMGDQSARTLVTQMLNQRRDYWLSRVHNQTDHRLGYQAEGQGVVALLEQPSSKQKSYFTCLNSLRDVEGTVNLILDLNPKGLRSD